MFSFLFSVLVSTCVVTSLEDKYEIVNEIDLANNEAKVLADELTDMLTRIEIEGEDIFQDEELYKEIVEKIKDLAEATEEENLIKLTETVKDRRIKKEEFQNSVANLQQLADKLEKASLSSNSKHEKDSERVKILETATKDNQAESHKLQLEQFNKFYCAN